MADGRHLENHYDVISPLTTVDGPIWMKFGRQMQNDMLIVTPKFGLQVHFDLPKRANS